MKRKAFMCEACGECYPTNHSDEEAEKEYQKTFGVDAPKDRGLVCDQCYEIFMKLVNEGVIEVKEDIKLN